MSNIEGAVKVKSKPPSALVRNVESGTSSQVSPGRFMCDCRCTVRLPGSPTLPRNRTAWPAT